MKRILKMFSLLLLLSCVFLPSNLNVQAIGEDLSKDVINLDDSNLVVGDVLSFDQVVEKISEYNDISISEAKKQVMDNSTNTRTGKAAATYRELAQYFTVDANYSPSLRFFCETDEGGGSFRAINKIINVSMKRDSNGMSKQFSGTVYTLLKDSRNIYYQVNGDFLNNGTTTVNAGVDIGIGKSATIKFGVSYSTSFYKYCYASGTFTW